MNEFERGLGKLFAVVTEEAGRNPVFANRLQEAVLTLSEGIDKATQVDTEIRGLNPYLLYKEEGREGLVKILEGKSSTTLRELVRRHNADPSGTLGRRPRKAQLVDVMADMVEDSAEQDERLFAY